MITYVTGNIFHAPAQVLVNTVNTVGVMGKGLAYEFKRIYPEMFRRYRELCEQGLLQTGTLWLYKSPNKWILNFPTKKHWRNPSRIEYIEAGLVKFRQVYTDYGIHSIAFPALGCGNGQLNFETQVRPVMEQYLRDLPIDIFIYPDRADPYPPEHLRPEEFRRWLRTQPETLPFSEVWDDLRDLITHKKTFKTIARKRQFKAEILPDNSGIRIIAKSTRYLITKEELLTFWQQLRMYGYSARAIAPNIGVGEISYLISIFSELSYVKPVRLAGEYGKLHKQAVIGLQFIEALARHSHPYHSQLKPIQMALF